MWKNLRHKIADVIQATDSFAFVSSKEVGSIPGFPAVIVVPSEHENDWATTGDGTRQVFTFRAQMLMPEKEMGSEDDTLDDLVDLMLATFSDPDVLDPYADFVEPAVAAWGYQGRPQGDMRSVEIRIRCIKYL